MPATPPPSALVPAGHGHGRALAVGAVAAAGVAAGARALWLAAAARRFAGLRGDRFDRPGAGR